MGLLRNIADKLKGKKQEAIEIDYNPQEEPEGLKVPSESSEESTSASVLAEAFGEAEDGALIMACPCSLS